MGYRARAWWLIGGGIAVVALGSALAIVHELAPSRCPELAIRWSPSVDHVMRAGVAGLEAHLRDADGFLATATARFPTEALERRAGHDPADALRTTLFLVARATGTSAHCAEPGALDALRRMAAAPDPAIRWAVIVNLGASQERAELIERALMDDDYRVVEEALDRYCRGRLAFARSSSPLIASPAALDRLVALLDADTRPAMVSDAALDPGAQLRSRTVLLRRQRPDEAAATAAAIRRKAWTALAIHAAARARALAAGRGFTPETAGAVAEGLGASAEGVPWLVELLRHPDPRVAAAAESSLAELAFAGQRVDGACVIGAWEALAGQGGLGPLLDRAAGYRYQHCLSGLRRWSAADVERILALVPEPHRGAIVAAL